MSRPISRVLPLTIAATLALLACGHANIGASLIDVFHEGEYLSTRQLFGASAHPPLLIHGYLDYIPARTAEIIFGVDHLIAGTRLINLFLGSLAAFSFMGCLLHLSRSRPEMLGALLIGGALLLSINARAADVIGLHQASPAVRDLFLLVQLWLLVAATEREDRSGRLLATAAGVVCGFGTFWAYNRGIAGIAALLAYLGFVLFADRSWQRAIWPGIGFIAGSLVCFAVEPAIWSQHIANMLFWHRNGGIWSVALSTSEIARISPLVVTGGASLALGVVALWRCCSNLERRS